jgi:hypothetical protein
MNKAEKIFTDKVASLGCIVCLEHLGVESPANIHHIREGMGMAMRNDNFNILPLCKIHHQDGDGTAKVQGQWGFHKNKTQFENKYGTELELLAIMLDKIN